MGFKSLFQGFQTGTDVCWWTWTRFLRNVCRPCFVELFLVGRREGKQTCQTLGGNTNTTNLIDLLRQQEQLSNSYISLFWSNNAPQQYSTLIDILSTNNISVGFFGFWHTMDLEGDTHAGCSPLLLLGPGVFGSSTLRRQCAM